LSKEVKRNKGEGAQEYLNATKKERLDSGSSVKRRVREGKQGRRRGPKRV